MDDIAKQTATNQNQIQETLSTLPNEPFSIPAFTLLKREIEGYIVDLVEESSRISRRHRSDTISATHVEQAAANLISSTRNRFFRHIGTVGGILFGAGLSTILSLLTASTISPSGLMIASGFSIVGAFLVAMHVVKD
jgi:hypothetical protein